MTRFLKTDDGGLINADRIERIREREPVGGPRGLGRSSATLSDGISVTLAYDVDTTRACALPVVAAAPGYVRLRYYDWPAGCGDPEVVRLPVVAWRIAEDCAIPVTLDAAAPGSLCIGEAVLQPDGQVVMPYDGRFSDETEWREEMEMEAKDRRKPKLVDPNPAKG
jgi:hypothetical protein